MVEIRIRHVTMTSGLASATKQQTYTCSKHARRSGDRRQIKQAATGRSSNDTANQSCRHLRAQRPVRRTGPDPHRSDRTTHRAGQKRGKDHKAARTHQPIKAAPERNKASRTCGNGQESAKAVYGRCRRSNATRQFEPAQTARVPT